MKVKAIRETVDALKRGCGDIQRAPARNEPSVARILDRRDRKLAHGGLRGLEESIDYAVRVLARRCGQQRGRAHDVDVQVVRVCLATRDGTGERVEQGLAQHRAV
jgi:hypothetical protein